MAVLSRGRYFRLDWIEHSERDGHNVEHPIFNVECRSAQRQLLHRPSTWTFDIECSLFDIQHSMVNGPGSDLSRKNGGK